MARAKILEPDVGTRPRVARAARAIERREEVERREKAGILRRRIDVMRAAGIPEKQIDAVIRKEFAKRERKQLRERAARKLEEPT